VLRSLAKKEFSGRTDIDIEINNNSAILSRLLRKCEAEQNIKALELIKKTPLTGGMARQHYVFHGNSPPPLDLDTIVAGFTLA
jgi:hypothetical protein